MRRGAHFVASHPQFMLVIHAAAAVLLGCVTSWWQQRWVPDSYLLLHIGVWWTLGAVLLLDLLNRRPGPVAGRDEFSDVCLDSLLYGDSPRFRDEASEADDDLPAGTEHFRTICLELSPRWNLEVLTVSTGTSYQSARFAPRDGAGFTLLFANWDFAWFFGVDSIHGLSGADVRSLLSDLHNALTAIEGTERIKWFRSASGTCHAQMSKSDQESGADLPFATGPA